MKLKVNVYVFKKGEIHKQIDILETQ